MQSVQSSSLLAIQQALRFQGEIFRSDAEKNYFKWAKNGASKEFYEQESPESTAFQMTLPSAPFADFLRNEL